MSFSTEYVEILNHIIELAVAASKEDRILSKKTVTVDIQLSYGRTRKKVDEYFKVLEDAEKIRVEGDEFWLAETSQTPASSVNKGS